MEFWSETLDLNSELSQFDIEDDALDDPSLLLLLNQLQCLLWMELSQVFRRTMFLR